MCEYFKIYLINNIIPQTRPISHLCTPVFLMVRSHIYQESNAICGVLISKAVYPDKKFVR
jgi:hypothetical protein